MTNPYLNVEDKELMLLYQKDEYLAFDELYRRYKDNIYAYLSKRLHNKGELEDLFQKVLVKFHKSRKLYNPKYDVLPWLYTITKSEFLDHIKKNKIETQSFDEKIHAVEEPMIQSDFSLIDAEGISKREKSAIELRYLRENEFQEIAALLETSESNVRKIISRGIKKLKTKYQGAKS